jgi:DNA-binding SARP family transcriptional activator/tetratricopeptide (TPR) repeat protein
MDGRGLLVSLLGPVQVSVDGRPERITQPRLRALLAMLALSPNRVVPVPTLIDALWQEPASRPRERNLHAHVSQLRARLKSIEPDRTESRLTTRRPGYVLALGPDELDLSQFAALADHGRHAARAGDPATAADAFRRAVALWRGEALADVAGISDQLAGHADRLEEQRLAVLEECAETGLATGRHTELTVELAALVDQHPLRERLRGLLMLALCQSGRQAEALARYQEGRLVLRRELAVGPGRELQDLHQRILQGDPALAPPALGGVPAVSTRPLVAGPAVPRQLPIGVRHFAGRDDELARLDELLGAVEDNGTVIITAIGGTGGVGKTALAVHWAHQVAHRFPDGQLHVNLRGYDPGGIPVTPAGAIREILSGLGRPSAQIPDDLTELTALYQSALAGRRLLILLDNARDAAQVRPLLVAPRGCLVVVTSRSALADLSTSAGAVPIHLGLASEAEAEAMLAARLGERRLAAEPDAVAEVIQLCARLPLALAITAARAVLNPAIRLAEFAAELRGEHGRLDALDVGDAATSLRSVFSWSTAQLGAGAARMFRLLGLHPGPTIGAPAAASLAGISLPQARELLAELVDAGVLTEDAHGRFAFHDLLRVFAAEQAAETEAAADQRAAIGRMLDHYLYTAAQAGAQIFGAGLPLPDLAPLATPGVRPEHLDNSREALAWFEAEHLVLIACAELATASGFDSYAWQIPCTMTQYFRASARGLDWQALNLSALAAAQRLGDDDALGRVRFSMGTYDRVYGNFDDAIEELTRSMLHFRATGNRVAQAAVHMGISMAHISRRPTLPPGDVGDDARVALTHASEALGICREAGDLTGQQWALRDLGEHYLALGELPMAEKYCREAIRLGAATGDRAGEGEAIATMGRISYRLGNNEAAVACYQQVLRIRREDGIRIRPVNVLEDLGDAYLAAGDLDAAWASWREVIEQDHQLKQVGGQPSWRTARVLAKFEQVSEAQSLLRSRHGQDLPVGEQRHRPPQQLQL